MGPGTDTFDELVRALALPGAGLGLARGFARLLPTVVMVPAFGLRGLPVAVRGAIALCLALAVGPALSSAAPEAGGVLLTLVGDVLRGLPLALAGAVPMWAAGMAGGLFDELRGAALEPSRAAVPEANSPSATLLTLLAGTFFFSVGGPSVIARAALRAEVGAGLLEHTVGTLAAGMTVALLVAGPLLAAGVVVAAGNAVLARGPFSAARGALPSLRGIAMLTFFAVALERVAVLLALLTERGVRGG